MKIRGPELDAVAGIDVRPRLGEEGKTKLERDVILRVPADTSPVADSKFSRSGSTIVSAGMQFGKLSDVASVFPVLETLGLGDPSVPIVRGIVAQEVKYRPGSVVFGDCKADASFTLWYRGGLDDTVAAFHGELLTVEFSFDYEIKDECAADTLHDTAIDLLQRLGSDEWMEDGAKTKTQILYGL